MNRDLNGKINYLIETGEFLKISNPVRYMGGEFGCVDPGEKPDSALKTAVCFPDTYEIGMSNMAVKILYEILNSERNILAERVFLPDPDAVAFFAEKEIPLYSLESKTPLKNFDFLLITVSSELLYTNILKILEISGIPARKEERTESDPIVIIGGPAVTNPLPLSRFADFVCIGEFEACFQPYTTVAGNPQLSRAERLSVFDRSVHYWRPGKKAVRAVTPSLSRRPNRFYPVPSVRLSQDHGSVEIMRGCPNGCRFCLAGIYYRPLREKALSDVISEIDHLVFGLGYREISLASLSSGDYSQIGTLMKILAERYKEEQVSFSLPSIKVNSFTLDLLEPLSGVKKSGLTLAVETPGEEGQTSVNKNVSREKLFSIIDAAKSRGWKLIKLYFMIGLPYYIDNPEKEKEMIIGLIRDIASYSGMAINVNIGTFIPKPHTPFQYSPQLPYEKAKEILKEIKFEFAAERKIKINYHDPFISYVESILSKGDDSCCDILEKAYRYGAQMDAWSEYFNREAWERAFSEHHPDIHRILSVNRDSYPWQEISLSVSDSFYKDEFRKSKIPELTSPCSETCDHPCGSCNRAAKISRTNVCSMNFIPPKPDSAPVSDRARWFILRFSRHGMSTYISQKNMIPLMERIFFRAGWKLQFTEGFNRKPKMEFANPLPIGYASDSDYMRIRLYNTESPDLLLRRISDVSEPSVRFLLLDPVEIPEQTHLPSLMSLYSSSEFLISALPDSGSLFKKHSDAVRSEAAGNDLLSVLDSGADYLRFNIKNLPLKKVLPFLDSSSGLGITRTETFFFHPVLKKELPFSFYSSYFKF